MGASVDIFEQQVIGRALQSAAEEMGINLLRNAFSSIVREAKDMSAAVFDAEGRLIAQADHIPILLSAMTTAVEACLAAVPQESLTPGTVLITNDPYRGCQHLNDIAVFLPVFVEGRRIAIVGCIAHHLDVGGAAPGILQHASEIFEEGKIIPPMALELEEGRLPELFTRILCANVRTPDELLGDLDAQMAALFAGRERLQHLAARYGAGRLTAVMDSLIESSRSVMSRVLEELEDFETSGSAQLDDDGIGGPPMVVRVTVRKRGGRLHLDFTGSDPQRPCMMNANPSSVLGAVWTLVRHVFGSGVTMWHNAGSMEPVEVTIPSGCHLNPTPPASVHGRVITAYRVYDALMDALAKVLPDRVTATGFNASICLALSRLHEGRFQIFVEVLSGGWGGRNGSDGPSALPFALSNCSNAPAEYVESQFRFLRIRRYGLQPHSAGPGRFRGGAGEVREYDVLADDVRLSVFSDRFSSGAPGVNGGAPGSPGFIEIERGRERLRLGSKTGVTLRRGDLLRIVGGGGGGYGPPQERAPAAAAADRAGGLVAAEAG